MPRGIFVRTAKLRSRLSKIAIEKGYGLWMRGKKLSEETKHKISEKSKLFRHTINSKQKISIARLRKKKEIGYLNSPETRKKMSISHLGYIPANKGIKASKEIRDKMSKSRMGVKLNFETRKKMSESHKGEKSYSWRGGITPINKIIRRSMEYRLWRETVFQRDNYTCIWCGQHGGILCADHIKQFAYYPELRFAIDNGRTLCKPCHKTTETFNRKY